MELPQGLVTVSLHIYSKEIKKNPLIQKFAQKKFLETFFMIIQNNPNFYQLANDKQGVVYPNNEVLLGIKQILEW